MAPEWMKKGFNKFDFIPWRRVHCKWRTSWQPCQRGLESGQWSLQSVGSRCPFRKPSGWRWTGKRLKLVYKSWYRHSFEGHMLAKSFNMLLCCKIAGSQDHCVQTHEILTRVAVILSFNGFLDWQAGVVMHVGRHVATNGLTTIRRSISGACV